MYGVIEGDTGWGKCGGEKAWRGIQGASGEGRNEECLDTRLFLSTALPLLAPSALQLDDTAASCSLPCLAP